MTSKRAFTFFAVIAVVALIQMAFSLAEDSVPLFDSVDHAKEHQLEQILEEDKDKVMQGIRKFLSFTGFANATPGHLAMIVIGLVFIFLAIRFEYEPLLLVPIGTGIIIGIIGGADGPTAIFLSSKLANGGIVNGIQTLNLIGPIAIAAYSYMALVPVIQPPIMRLLTNKRERLIKMKPPRSVSRFEKIMFPLVGLILTTFLRLARCRCSGCSFSEIY